MLNERGLAVGVGDAVVWVSGGQVALESLVGERGLRMRDEVVAKEQTLPMLPECRAAGDWRWCVRTPRRSRRMKKAYHGGTSSPKVGRQK